MDLLVTKPTVIYSLDTGDECPIHTFPYAPHNLLVLYLIIIFCSTLFSVIDTYFHDAEWQLLFNYHFVFYTIFRNWHLFPWCRVASICIFFLISFKISIFCGRFLFLASLSFILVFYGHFTTFTSRMNISFQKKKLKNKSHFFLRKKSYFLALRFNS